MKFTSDIVPPGLIRGSYARGLTIFVSGTLPISITLCYCIDYRKVYGAPFLSFGLFYRAALH